MLLRKINAIISLLTTILLLAHAILMSVWLISNGSVARSALIVPRILVGLMALHAFISIYFAACSIDDGDRSNVKSYPKMNGATVFQRASGLLLIVLTALHVASAMGAVHMPHIVYVMVFSLFFAISLAHAAISTGKAFITLGIGNAKFVKGVSVVMKVICAATVFADILGLYLFMR